MVGGCDRSRALCIVTLVLVGLWVYMFLSLFAGGNIYSAKAPLVESKTHQQLRVPQDQPSQVNIHRAKSTSISKGNGKTDVKRLLSSKLELPLVQTTNEEFTEPPPLEEVAANVSRYLHTIHERFKKLSGPTVTAEEVWEAFVDETKKGPMTWDDINKHRFPKPRRDNSIFVSLGSYRDPFCPMTIKSLFDNAKRPEKVFVGLFQQNCFGPVCKTGVLIGGKVEDTSPDINCYTDFCSSPEGIRSQACERNQVRLFNVNESESLGPYMARYLGSKFYRGEQYYLQIDSHSEFVSQWDEKLIRMVETAEAEKPVISTYPPDSHTNWRDTIGYRMCDSEFASAQIEWQIVRLGTSLPFDKKIPEKPKYAPFVAAGFFFGPAELLHEVPFDPFLPWIFMGEEISVSARLWTSGYDIFSPTTNVLNHYYVRRHYPKFWESVNRFFGKPSIHNDIVEIIINRVKYMLGYPESKLELVHPSSVLFRQDDWSMGRKRSLEQYMKMVGLDMTGKKVRKNMWCHKGDWPEEALPYRISKT